MAKTPNNTTQTKLLPGGVTQVQIDQWKAKHGEVKQLVVPKDDTGKNFAFGYCRKPDMDVIGAASRFADSEVFEAGKILFDNCFLGGDPEMREDPEVRLSATMAISQLFKIRKAEIKNM